MSNRKNQRKVFDIIILGTAIICGILEFSGAISDSTAMYIIIGAVLLSIVIRPYIKKDDDQ